MKLLYITYIDFDGKGKSGSSVRPQKMYKAFLQMGLDVKLLECQQNKFKERRKRVKEILHWLDNNTHDLCYIESPSGPIFNQIDLKLIKKVHKMGIPIGYFYRDAFWLFPEKQKNINIIKRAVIYYLNLKSLYIIKKCCDIVYFSTESTKQLFARFNFNKCELLPPAAFIIPCTKKQDDKKNTCIFVGGVSYDYGTDILIEAFKILNNNGGKYNLILICRENDYKNFFPEPLDFEWLKVIHESGDALEKHYSLAEVGLMPARKTPYMNIAMSVKIFEYIGHGLPIISTNTTEMGKFVLENEVGIVCEDNPESLANAIEYFFSCNNRCDMLRNVEKIAQKNTWECRAIQVMDELLKLKNG